jgi:hypothetical protein
MEIPKDARKCPFCQHFQNRTVMLIYSPIFVGLFATVPLICIMFLFSTFFDRGESFETYKDQITITESQFDFGETKSGKTIAVIGTIKNNSPIPWTDIQIHADFYDPRFKRIDVGEKKQSSFYLPPNGTSSFKISFPLEFPESNYVKTDVKVATAKDARARW